MCNETRTTINSIAYLRDNKISKKLCERLAKVVEVGDDAKVIPVYDSGELIGSFTRINKGNMFSYSDALE